MADPDLMACDANYQSSVMRPYNWCCCDAARTSDDLDEEADAELPAAQAHVQPQGDNPKSSPLFKLLQLVSFHASRRNS